jgi:hypothetical protein
VAARQWEVYRVRHKLRGGKTGEHMCIVVQSDMVSSKEVCVAPITEARNLREWRKYQNLPRCLVPLTQKGRPWLTMDSVASVPHMFTTEREDLEEGAMVAVLADLDVDALKFAIGYYFGLVG